MYIKCIDKYICVCIRWLSLVIKTMQMKDFTQSLRMIRGKNLDLVWENVCSYPVGGEQFVNPLL